MIKAHPYLPNLLDQRAHNTLTKAIADIRERLAKTIPKLLYYVSSYEKSPLAMIAILDKLETDLRAAADESASALQPPLEDNSQIPGQTMELDDLVTLDQVAPPTNSEPVLGERARLVLAVLGNEKAFDSDHRMRTSDIVLKAAGKAADPNPYKEVIAQLKQLAYIQTKEGRGGGCWLTGPGQTRAEKL